MLNLSGTRDPLLIKKIGEATALEVRATGIPYAFSPCIAVREPFIHPKCCFIHPKSKKTNSTIFVVDDYTAGVSRSEVGSMLRELQRRSQHCANDDGHNPRIARRHPSRFSKGCPIC